MTDLAQSSPPAPRSSKLGLLATEARISCLLAGAAQAPSASAYPATTESQVSTAKRVNLRKQNSKRHTYGPKKPVKSTPSQPSTPTTPTTPTTPSTPTKPT